MEYRGVTATTIQLINHGKGHVANIDEWRNRLVASSDAHNQVMFIMLISIN